jgi:putative acetyltransferase
MNEVRILVDDLSGPRIAAFLDEHVREMRSITPPESKYALDLDGLRKPEITFWSVMDGDAVVGCGALKRLDARHAELKSMRVAAARRRAGIASLLLEHLIAEARRRGFDRLSLETGTAEFFRPARTLYERFGFVYCGPFADYQPSPHNLFMTLALEPGRHMPAVTLLHVEDAVGAGGRRFTRLNSSRDSSTPGTARFPKP